MSAKQWDAETVGIGGLPTVTYPLCVAVVKGGERKRVPVTQSGIGIGSAPDNELVVEARGVSRHHLRMQLHTNGVHLRDLESRNGTFVGGVGVNDVVVAPGTLIVVGDCELLVEPDLATVEIPLAQTTRMGGMVGRSLGMRRLFATIERVAPTDYTVLVEGETGTGKELVARTVHELSPRRRGPFVVFDCAAATESLLESELFGHVKGAFTGAASAREGVVRRAHGGTLFIDELNSMPLSVQGKLLRVLETRRVQALGSDADTTVDIRVIAAANCSLSAEVQAKRFREDLYYRLSVVCVQVPPLRDRREDIALLARDFLLGAGLDLEVAGPNLDRLVGHGWPGNVRELRNAIDRALALAGTKHVAFADLPISVGQTTPTMAWPIHLDRPFKEAKDHLMQAFERAYATTILERANNNISEAARMAGLSRRGFFDLLRRHQITAAVDDGDDV